MTAEEIDFDNIIEPSSGTLSSSLQPGYFEALKSDSCIRSIPRKPRLDELDETNVDDDLGD